MIQSLLENALFAFLVAFLILVVFTIFGVLFGEVLVNREEIKKRNIDVYVRLLTVISLIIVLFYYAIQGEISQDSSVLLMFLVFLITLCTDWSRLRRSKLVEETPQS